MSHATVKVLTQTAVNFVVDSSLILRTQLIFRYFLSTVDAFFQLEKYISLTLPVYVCQNKKLRFFKQTKNKVRQCFGTLSIFFLTKWQNCFLFFIETELYSSVHIFFLPTRKGNFTRRLDFMSDSGRNHTKITVR